MQPPWYLHNEHKIPLITAKGNESCALIFSGKILSC